LEMIEQHLELMNFEKQMMSYFILKLFVRRKLKN